MLSAADPVNPNGPAVPAASGSTSTYCPGSGLPNSPGVSGKGQATVMTALAVLPLTRAMKNWFGPIGAGSPTGAASAAEPVSATVAKAAATGSRVRSLLDMADSDCVVG